MGNVRQTARKTVGGHARVSLTFQDVSGRNESSSNQEEVPAENQSNQPPSNNNNNNPSIVPLQNQIASLSCLDFQLPTSVSTEFFTRFFETTDAETIRLVLEDFYERQRAYFLNQSKIYSSIAESIRLHSHDQDDASLKYGVPSGSIHTSPERFVGFSNTSAHPLDVKKEDTAKPKTRMFSQTRRRRGQKERAMRVFISSTFRDMDKEREMLIKKVMPELRVICEERSVTFTEIDLRWGITAEQSLQGDTIQICLSEIDRCRPYFLSLLGERYGWSQPSSFDPNAPYSSKSDEGKGQKFDRLLAQTFDKASVTWPWINAYRDRSVTELEIRHAILDRAYDFGLSEKPMEAIFLLRKKEYALQQGNSFFLTEDAELQKKLDALKKEIRQNQDCKVFDYDDPTQIADLVREQFLSLIDRDFPLSEIPSLSERETLAQESFCESHCGIYVGSERYFQVIQSHLSDAFSSSTSSSPLLLVTGSPGSGKTALLSNFTKFHCETSPTDRLTLAHFVGSTSSSVDLSQMLKRMIVEISEWLGSPENLDSLPTDSVALISRFHQSLEHIPRGKELLLVIDGIERLDVRDASAAEYRWIPHRLPSNVQMILSHSLGPLDRLQLLRSKGIPMEEVQVQDLSPKEREEMTEMYMTTFGKQLTRKQSSLISQSKLTASPLFLKTLLEDLHVFGSFERLEERIHQCLSSGCLSALLDLCLVRIEQDFGADGVASVLRLVAVSRNGLQESEILSITGLSYASWSPLRLALKDFLANRSGFIGLANDQISQSVRLRYLFSAQLEEETRAQIINHFGPMKPSTHDRRCEELPFQWTKSQHPEAFQSLRNLLVSDIPFFLKLSSSRFVFDLYHIWSFLTSNPSPFSSPQLASEIEREAPAALARIHSTGNHHADFFSYLHDLLQICKFMEDMALYTTAQGLYTGLLSRKEMRPESTDLLEATERSRVRSKRCDVLESLGHACMMLGNYAKSAEWYQQALEAREAAVDESNSFEDKKLLAQSINSLAILHRKAGNYFEAETLYNRALSIRLDILDHNHLDVAQSYNSLGCLYHDVNRYRESEENLEKALLIREKILGSNHPQVAMTLSNIGALKSDAGRYQEAEKMLQRSLEVYEAAYGPLHHDVANVRNSLGGVLMEMGQYERAIDLYQQAVAEKLKLLGPDHPDLALSYNNLAVLFTKTGRLQEALEFYQKGLKVRIDSLGASHPDVAQSYNNLGVLHLQIDKTEEAVSFFGKALSVLQSRLGSLESQHAEVAQTYLHVASALQRICNRSLDSSCSKVIRQLPSSLSQGLEAFSSKTCFDLICEFYKRARAILELCFGTRSHPDVAVLVNDLAILNFRHQKIQTAEELFLQALEIHLDLFGPNHPETKKQLSTIADFYDQLGRHDDALLYKSRL